MREEREKNERMSNHNNRLDDELNIAIFCDFENVAIGVRDANYDSFNIALILERLLDKGKIVVKKAYADWERYKSAKRPMHEAAFELIEIPHVSYSGKNSADIRMVVDALDLCYTKSHVDMFVIVSGDSDFSPLVSKLRENDKKVIGLGVKKASSDLLIDNCDEFIYYDDLVREKQTLAKKDAKRGAGRPRRAPKGEPAPAPKKEVEGKPVDGKPVEGKPVEGKPVEGKPVEGKPVEGKPAEAPAGEARAKTQADEVGRKEEALELVLDTVEALFRDREDDLWGSMVKQTLKRKRPNFAETFYGYRTFNQLLEDAQKQGLLEVQKDEKSGGYRIISFGPNA
jgi:uncharacterized protein (TIGR00288 family)